MAKINQCRICQGNVVNADIHLECLVAELEDLLSEVRNCIIIQTTQNHLPCCGLPLELQKRIVSGSFKTLGQFKEELDQEEQRTFQR